MNRIKINLLFLMIGLALCSSCQLADAPNGQDCQANINGLYSQDVYSTPQTDSVTSATIIDSQICTTEYPYCINDVCSACRKDEVRVSENGKFSCVSCDDVKDCESESCANGSRRCLGLEKECVPGCSNGLLTECINGKTNIKSCSNGCNENKTGCNENDTICQIGEILIDGVCVCDTNNEYEEKDGKCIQVNCESNEIKDENGDCVCNRKKHWVDDGNNSCKCNEAANYYQKGEECIFLECKAHQIIENGECVCDAQNGYVQNGSECTKKTCSYPEILSGANCICDESKGWAGTSGNCSCTADGWLMFDNACTNIYSISTWRTVTFGNYQNESIQWEVIKTEGNSVYLLSQNIIDVLPFSDSPAEWADSTLHTWLNSTFLNSAFTESEISQIKITTVPRAQSKATPALYASSTTDRVFLMSYEETVNLWGDEQPNTRRCAQLTDYASTKGMTGDTNGNGWWWLRNPGDTTERAMHVTAEGKVYKGTVNNGVYFHNGGVRPVIVLGR